MSKQPPSSRPPDPKFFDSGFGYAKTAHPKKLFSSEPKPREDYKFKPIVYRPKEEVKLREHDKLSDKFRDLEAPRRIDKQHESDKAKSLYKHADIAAGELEKSSLADKPADRHRDEALATPVHSSSTRSPDRRHDSYDRHRHKHSSYRDSRERREHYREHHKRHGHSHSPPRKRRHSSRSLSRSYSGARTPPEPAGQPVNPPPPEPPRPSDDKRSRFDAKHSKHGFSQNPTEPATETSWKGYPVPKFYKDLDKFYDPIPKFNVFIPNLYFPLDGSKLRRYKQYKCYTDRLHKYDNPNYYKNELVSLLRADYAFLRRKLVLMDYETQFAQLCI